MKTEPSNAITNSQKQSSNVNTTTIVMIHGMWGGPSNWSNYKEFFEQQGFQVVTPLLKYHTENPKEIVEGLGNCSIQEM